MLESIFSADVIISFATLLVMEIVLGIDNIVFISIIVGKIPREQQEKARLIGISLALIIRILLLFGITLLIGLVQPLFTLMSHTVSGRDLILFAGGLFLIMKSTTEIHSKLEGGDEDKNQKQKGFMFTIIQIIILDIIFSIDSILTAVGLVQNIYVMIAAVVLAVIIMMLFAKPVSDFVHKHPTVKMLALSFLLMIGFLLVLESFHVEVPKGYVYFAMAFSFFVELLNLRMKKTRNPVKLNEPYEMPAIGN